MNVKVDALDKHKVALTIEVPSEEVGRGFRQAAAKIAGQVSLKGFRKGKAPRSVLEMYFGKEAIEEEAADILINKFFSEALREQNMVPVTKADIDRKHFKEGEDMTFVATFVCRPEVKLGNYKDLKADHDSPEVGDEQVTAQLTEAAAQNARLEVAEGKALEKGDYAIIDFAGKVDGKSFQGGEGKTYPLEIGSGSFIPGFEDQLTGHKAGDDVTVKVSFPADYFVKELAGKEAEFDVHISDVKKKVIPVLDDEFAKSVSHFETLDELKKTLKQRMQLQAIQKAEEAYHQALVDLAVKNAEVDIPEEMVNQRIDEMISEMKLSLESRDTSFDKYLKTIGKTEEELRKAYEETARENVRQGLVLEAIADKEGLQVSDQDLSMEIYSMAQHFEADPKEVVKIIKKENRVPMLIASVTRKKAAAFIYGAAHKDKLEAAAEPADAKQSAEEEKAPKKSKTVKTPKTEKAEKPAVKKTAAKKPAAKKSRAKSSESEKEESVGEDQ